MAELKIRTRGRPRKEEGKVDRSLKTIPITVSVPAWFAGQLTLQARSKGISLSELVRSYIVAGMATVKEQK
jgi:hypothetical protein